MFIAVALFSLLNACILFASSSKKYRGNTYLGYLFLIIALRGFTSGEVFRDLPINIRQFIFIYLLPFVLPLFFSIGPLLYFYVRQEVLNISFRFRQDFKHLLILLLSFINMFSYYTSSLALKKGNMDIFFQNPSTHVKVNLGLTTSAIYFIGSPIHTLFYLTLSLYTISNKNRFIANKLKPIGFELLSKWLYFILTIFYALAVFNLIISTYTLVTGDTLFILPPIITGIIFLILNIRFYKHPQIIFGIKFSKSNNSLNFSHINNRKSEVKFTSSFESNFNQKIDQYRISKEFVKSEFNIGLIAKDLDLPEYMVNNYFKTQLKIKFIHFRNELRIAYFCETIKKEDFNLYTSNSIAKKFGFSNITSLKKAFDTCKPESYETFYSTLIK
jgi:hypothetical protein